MICFSSRWQRSQGVVRCDVRTRLVNAIGEGADRPAGWRKRDLPAHRLSPTSLVEHVKHAPERRNKVCRSMLLGPINRVRVGWVAAVIKQHGRDMGALTHARDRPRVHVEVPSQMQRLRCAVLTALGFQVRDVAYPGESHAAGRLERRISHQLGADDDAPSGNRVPKVFPYIGKPDVAGEPLRASRTGWSPMSKRPWSMDSTRGV